MGGALWVLQVFLEIFVSIPFSCKGPNSRICTRFSSLSVPQRCVLVMTSHLSAICASRTIPLLQQQPATRDGGVKVVVEQWSVVVICSVLTLTLFLQCYEKFDLEKRIGKHIAAIHNLAKLELLPATELIQFRWSFDFCHFLFNCTYCRQERNFEYCNCTACQNIIFGLHDNKVH